MDIILASEKQKNDIILLLVESWLAKWNNRNEAIDAWMNMATKDMLFGDIFYVAYINNKPVWLISWRLIGEIRHWLAEIFRVWVSPSYQWQWIWKALFENMENNIIDYYKENEWVLRKLFVKTHESSIWARKYYESMWMSLETMLVRHFRSDEDHCIYSKFYS